MADIDEEAPDSGPWRWQWLGTIGCQHFHIDPLLEDCQPCWIQVEPGCFVVSPSIASWLTHSVEALEEKT